MADDVTFKVAGDVENILAALTRVEATFDKVFKRMDDFANRAEKPMAKAEGLLNGFFGKLTGGVAIGTFFGTAMTKAFDLIVDGVQGAVTALPKLIDQVAATGDRFLTMSQRTGVAVEALSQFDFVASQTGTDLDVIARNVFNLTRNLGKGGDEVGSAMRKVGLSLNEMRQAKPEEAFVTILEALGRLPTQAERASAGAALFGNQFRNIANLTKENIRGLMAEADRLGLTMSEAAAKMGDRFNDAKDRLARTFEGIKRQIGIAFLPAAIAAIETFQETLAAVFGSLGVTTGTWADTTQQLIRKVLAGFAGFVEGMAPLVSSLIELMIPMGRAFTLGFEAVTKFLLFVTKLPTEMGARVLGLMGDMGEATAETMLGIRNAASELANVMPTIRGSLDSLEPVVKRFSASGAAAMTGFADKVITKFDEIVASLAKTEQAAGGAGKGFIPATEQMEKFSKSIRELAAELSQAEAANAGPLQIFQAFGEAASKAVATAKLLPGAFDALPARIKELGAQWDQQQLAEKMQDLAEKTRKTELELRKLGDAAGADLMKRLGAAFEQTKEFGDRLFLAQKTGIDRQLAEIDLAEKAALATFEKLGLAHDQLWENSTKTIKANFADLRAVARKFTGDIERDAELRGVKTRKMLNAELAEHRKTLAMMLANETSFTKAQKDQQKERVKAAEIAAGGHEKVWRSVFEAIKDGVSESAQRWAQFAQAVDGAMGKVAGAVAKGMNAANIMLQDIDQLLKAKDMIGAIIAAVNLAIDAIGLMWDALTRTPGEDVVRRVAKRLGVEIGEELGNAIAETAKKHFNGDRFAAEVFHLADVIDAAGGITEENFDRLLGGLRDTFSLLESGMFTVEQARTVLDKNFGAFADHVLKSNQIASQSFTELLRLNAELGVNSKEIADFVSSQTSRLGAAFAKMIAPTTKATTALTEEIKKETEELKKLEKDGGRAYDDQNKKVAALLVKQKQMARSALPEIDRAARLLTASFNAAVASGVSMVDAVDQLGPGLDQVLKNMENLGIKVEDSSVAWIVQFRNRVNANKELVESTGSLNEIMLAMSNIGALNAETMADLGAQGAQNFERLRAAGFSENETLTMMKGFLESVLKAHRDMGLPIDANTQALIDQGLAAGIVKEQQMSMVDVMREGLGAIIQLLGGDLPEAWKTMKESAEAATSEVKDDVTRDVGGSLDQLQDRMRRQPWGDWAGKAAFAASIAGRAVDGTASALSDVERELQQQAAWDEWARNAEEAASRAQDAVDAVSFGESPGGIKEIPRQLLQATEAAASFADRVAEEMALARHAVESIPPAGLSGTIAGTQVVQQAMADTTRRAVDNPLAAAAAAGGGDDVSLQFYIQAYDGPSVELSVERQILPAMVKVLRRGRQLGDLQTVLAQ